LELGGRKMRTKYILIVGGLLIAVLVAFRIATYGNGKTPDTISMIHEREGIPVTAAVATTGTIVRAIGISGTLEGSQQADVTSRLLETVQNVHVREGQSVQAGRVVATLARTSAQAQIDQAEAAYFNAQSDYERMQALYEQGAVSLQALDGATTALTVAKANLESAASLIELRAPISGRITDVFVEPGQVANPGQPLVRIARLDRLVLKAEVPESEVVHLRRGQTASVSMDAYPDTTLPGVVGAVALSADPRSRQFKVEVDIRNLSGMLRPGVYAHAEIEVERADDAVVIPTGALRSGDDGAYVYLINDDVIHVRRVVAGLSDGEFSQISSGLEAGDRVVVRGINLSEGVGVRVMEDDR
jgi:membrane fusion protein (multidrug efflux system)